MPYDTSFYDTYSDDSIRSARAFAALLMDEIQPRSILDVGCGIGTWLRAFLDAGAESVVGVDGPYVDRSQLLIPTDRFVAWDLSRPLVLPDALPQSYDLAISMEVGEHLPEAASRTLVRSLTSRAPAVLFSAAIPHQGGTDHINEQWQRYWAQHFADEGFVPIDRFRPAFWEAPEVAYYYVQNGLLFLREDRIAEVSDGLRDHVVSPDDPALDRIHPRKWMEAHDPQRQPLRRVLSALPHAVRHAVARRLSRA